MKVVLVFALFAVSALSLPRDFQLKSAWDSFKAIHNKKYELVEELERMNIFKKNLEKIEKHNELYEQGLSTYKMGINQFADMTTEEFLNYLNTSTRSTTFRSMATTTFRAPLNVELPKSVDWRTKGAVTPVKNQKQCGSCWAFSTTGSLEGQNALKNGKLVALSEQELVDCDREDAGCDGGLMETAFEYVKKNGLTTEKAYPYEGYDGTCRRGNHPEAVRNSGFVAIESEAEDDLAAAVATVGPISVAVDASDWSFYSEGIFDGYCGSDEYSLNHGVLAVGYTADAWIIKNSWGASFGEDGYIRLQRNMNKCGVATDSSYPLL